MSPTAFPTNSRSFPSSITIALPSSRLPHDLLHLRVLFHPEAPALAADAALLEAAEGRVEEVDAVVDPHHAGADPLGERDRPGCRASAPCRRARRWSRSRCGSPRPRP